MGKVDYVTRAKPRWNQSWDRRMGMGSDAYRLILRITEQVRSPSGVRNGTDEKGGRHFHPLETTS